MLHTSTLIGRKVYVIGGYETLHLDYHLESQHCLLSLDLQTYEWKILESKVDMTEIVTSHSATLVDDRILLLGGFNRGESKPFGYFPIRWFDPVMNTVKKETGWGAVPTSRFGHVAGFFESRRQVLIHGGMEKYDRLADLYALNVDTMEFLFIKCTGRAPPPQHSHFACMHRDTMFMFCNYGNANVFELWLLEYKGFKPQWSLTDKTGEIPKGVEAGSMTYYYGKLIVFGGTVGFYETRDLHVFDLNRQVWTNVTAGSLDARNGISRRIGPAPLPVTEHTGILVDSKIVFLGGSSNRLDESWELHIS